MTVLLDARRYFCEITAANWKAMKPSDALRSHREDIRRVVEQNRTRNPRVFGSVLHGSDSESSDPDLLVDPIQGTTLMDIARIQNSLQKLLGVPVDVLTPKSLPDKFRSQVVAEAIPV
jgi:predicted nucleotidyltransferase